MGVNISFAYSHYGIISCVFPVWHRVIGLLPADLKSLYVGPSEEEAAELISQFQPNPFADDFTSMPCTKKGGIYITENILYGCVQETDWSVQIANMVVTNEWKCPNCENSFFINGIQRLQHRTECVPKPKSPSKEENLQETPSTSRSHGSNTKLFDCPICKKSIYLTSVEILKHKRSCK